MIIKNPFYLKMSSASPVMNDYSRHDVISHFTVLTGANACPYLNLQIISIKTIFKIKIHKHGSSCPHAIVSISSMSCRHFCIFCCYYRCHCPRYIMIIIVKTLEDSPNCFHIRLLPFCIVGLHTIGAWISNHKGNLHIGRNCAPIVYIQWLVNRHWLNSNA